MSAFDEFGIDRESLSVAPVTRTEPPAARPDCATNLLALGDVHGDAGPVGRYLLANDLIRAAEDDTMVWSAPDTVLIQTGDLPDRGTDTVLIAEALASLREDGARIITLLGNHDVPYLLTDDTPERQRRLMQAAHYMMDADGRLAPRMEDVVGEYLRQALAVTALHQHPDGGLVALRVDDVLFLHAEPGPATFTDEDIDQLGEQGFVRFQPERHDLEHAVFWGRAYSFGTDDVEGGYAPRTQASIPPARQYQPELLARHEQEPAIRDLYQRLADIGVRRIVHGHVPNATVRRYRVCGIEHINIDEAMSRHYRLAVAAAGAGPLEDFLPQGWSRERDAAWSG